MTPTSPTAAQPTTAPAPIPDTASMLSGVAAQQRRIIGTLDGLDEATMRGSVVPSGWTFAGMVQHLTRMTSFWFDHVLSGGPLGPPPGDDFDVAPEVDVATLVEQFALAGERGRTRVVELRLDGAPAWWPVDTFGPWRLRSVFEVLHHLTVETRPTPGTSTPPASSSKAGRGSTSSAGCPIPLTRAKRTRATRASRMRARVRLQRATDVPLVDRANVA